MEEKALLDKFKVFKFVRLARDAGIEPVNELLCKLNVYSLSMRDSSEGTVELNLFCVRYNSCMSVSCPNSLGRAPETLLTSKRNHASFVQRPSSEGRLPVSRFKNI